ncbi:MAG: hypothetical protein HYY06_11275 [Deltaproteobacteria bacterium]|nr:hypothetical protein [Deltaproteobacteria bacterium]
MPAPIRKAPRRLVVHTIGHSNRTFDELLALLRESGIRRVADVRSFPAGKFLGLATP